MIVKYKGQKYKCKFKDKFAIKFIKIKLCLKRCIRLSKVALPKSDLLLYMMIIFLWLIFAWISNLIEFQNNQVHESYLSTLWGLKNSVFSSVVLAFAIGSFNHIKEYRKMIKRQHYIYVDTMEDFVEIIRAADDTDIWLKFYPMYNKQCLSESLAYLDNKEIKRDDIDFLSAIDTANERIDMVAQELKAGHLLVQDEVLMNSYLSESKKLLTKVVLDNDRNYFEKLLKELYEILNQLRYLWRRDEKNDSRIICILAKDDINDIRNDFYKRMLLPDFKLDSLE